MWDAQEQYWKGYEWTKHLPGNTGQPTLELHSSPNYPQSSSDTNHRWFHESSVSGIFDATQSCAGLPNVNEMTWYAAKGDPHWDGDELWTTMGHLYKGGVWFKKKANISGFNTNTAVDGTDWRINGNSNTWSASYTLPDAADAGSYFYLPALGRYYNSGQLAEIGQVGFYWSSCSWNSNDAYQLGIGPYIDVRALSCQNGFRVDPLFE